MASGGTSLSGTPSLRPSSPLPSPSPLSSITNSTSPEPNTAGEKKPNPTTICVFCGSKPGKSPAHMEAARSLAQAFARENIHLVYGGGTEGLMGEVARTLVSLAGPSSVHGIIPSALISLEASGAVPSEAIYGRTTIVKDMHTRKELMARQVIEGGPGSGFVALSGGYGTLEELMEVVTWNQLGIHSRGVVVYNVDGYWDGLLEWVKGSVGAGFVGVSQQHILSEAKTAEEAVEALRKYQLAKGRYDLQWGNE